MFSFLQDGLLMRLFAGTGEDAYTLYLLAFAGFTLGMIAISYLLGSLNSAIVLSRILYRDDIRKHGSGNAGLTNMLRTYGKGAAGLTLLGDILKTALAVLVGGILFGFGYTAGISLGSYGMCYIAGLFAVLGHIFPIYYKFKGGKGVLATATMALILTPIPMLILLALFVVIVAVSKYVSLGSIVGAIFYPVVCYIYCIVAFDGLTMPAFMALSTILLAIIIVFCHRGNIQRIQNHTERKLSFKKKPEADETVTDDDAED